MYRELLVSAFESEEALDGEPTTSEAIVHLLQCRVRLDASLSQIEATEGPYVALTDQVAYDVALIMLAQRVGIECSAREFDVRERARARLEEALLAHGIPVGEIDGFPGEPPDGLGEVDGPPLTL